MSTQLLSLTSEFFILDIIIFNSRASIWSFVFIYLPRLYIFLWRFLCIENMSCFTSMTRVIIVVLKHLYVNSNTWFILKLESMYYLFNRECVPFSWFLVYQVILDCILNIGDYGVCYFSLVSIVSFVLLGNYFG